jgi:hypothetical protein
LAGTIAQKSETHGRDTVRRRAIVVVGMPRSGNSTMARTLAFLGAGLPRTTRPEGDTVNWGESEPILRLHEELFDSAGTSWDDLLPLQGSGGVEDYRARMVNAVIDEYGDSNLFVVNDPRICRLVPFWVTVLEQLGVEPAFVLPVRHPLEIAAALARRDRMPAPYSALLWLGRVLDAERDTRGHLRAFVSYEDFLREPISSARVICDRLGLDGRRIDQGVGAALEELIAGRRDSPVKDPRAPEDILGDWVEGAYGLLLDACRPGAEPDHEALDRLRTGVANAHLLYAPHMREVQRSRRASEQRLSETAEKLTALKVRLASLEAKLEESERRVRRAEDRLGVTSEQLRVTRSALGELVSAHHRGRIRLILNRARWVAERVKGRDLRRPITALKLSRSGRFDRDFYLSQNPDVLRSGQDPLLHFVLHGAAEQRAPEPPMLWIISGPSSIGKSTLRSSPRIREITSLGPETPMVHSRNLKKTAGITRNSFLHYNILRQADRAIRLGDDRLLYHYAE